MIEIEAAIGRQGAFAAEMPFADAAGAIARGAQQLGDGGNCASGKLLIDRADAARAATPRRPGPAETWSF